jgi:hypothetical protein
VQYSGDGKVLSVGHTQGVSLIDMDVGSWIEKAKRMIYANFTSDEWDRFYPDEPYHRTIRSRPWPNDLPEDERKRAEALENENPEVKAAP